MKTIIETIFIISIIASLNLSAAFAKPHPHALPPQPNMRNAYNALMATNKDLAEYELAAKPKLLKSALVHLDTAKTLLDDAKNNKGPYRHLATKAIDAAVEKIKLIDQDPANTKAAKEELQKAIDATSDGMRVGR